jgi:hypothetical protein
VNNQAWGDNIMTSRHWRAAAFLAPAAITVALATPAAAAASPSWQLTDQYTAHPACFTTAGGSEYLELNLNGTWSPLTFGASGLPAGGSYSDTVLYFADSTGVETSSSPGPIPAGSSNGTGPFTVNSQTFGEAYVITDIPSGRAPNSTFTITFWASDGTTTQTESVPIVIKTSCKRHY